MKNLGLSSTLLLLFTATMNAQENQGFTWDAGAGVTYPFGTLGRSLDYGWNVHAGVGYNFIPRVGAMLDFGFNTLGVNSVALTNLQYGGGNIRVFQATVDPVFHIFPHRRYDLYVTGGGGLYHTWQTLTNRTAPAIDPNFIYYLIGYGPSYSVNKPGFNIGMGFSVGTRWRGKVFAEARYNRVFTDRYPTDYIPVTLGFRW